MCKISLSQVFCIITILVIEYKKITRITAIFHSQKRKLFIELEGKKRLSCKDGQEVSQAKEVILVFCCPSKRAVCAPLKSSPLTFPSTLSVSSGLAKLPFSYVVKYIVSSEIKTFQVCQRLSWNLGTIIFQREAAVLV